MARMKAGRMNFSMKEGENKNTQLKYSRDRYGYMVLKISKNS